jgi:hypothetical protein
MVCKSPEFDNPALRKQGGKGPLHPAGHLVPPSLSGRNGMIGAEKVLPFATSLELMGEIVRTDCFTSGFQTKSDILSLLPF